MPHRCFPSMENGDRSPTQLKFNNLVCNNLKCVNGILKVVLSLSLDRPHSFCCSFSVCVFSLTSAVSTHQSPRMALFSQGGLHKDAEQEVFVSTMLRILIVLVIVGIVAMQGG